MFGKVDLVLRTPVKSGENILAQVTVTGAKPGGSVTVALEQTRGVAPLYGPAVVVVTADATGKANADFKVALQGPASAVLLASAYDSFGPHYEPDAEIVQVTE